MLAHEHAVLEPAQRPERQTQRGGVRPERIVGSLGILQQVRPRLDALVFIATPIAVGPAIEGAEVHACHVIRREVRPQHVALVDHSPQRFAHWLPRHANRITQAACVNTHRLGVDSDFENVRAVIFGFHPALADVRCRTDTDIKETPVFARDNVLGPMIATAGQFDQRLGLRRDRRLTRHIRKFPDGVVIADEKPVADQRHAERRVEVLQKHRADIGNAIAIAIAQQGNPVRRRRPRPCAFHQPSHDDVRKALWRRRRLVGLRHQHITIGQLV